jgi:SAM-dependent methyltransferase
VNNTAHLIPRRSDYESIGGEQEYFVIPLLRGAIYDALAKYAATPRAGAQALDIGAGECPLKNKIENLGFHYVSLDIAQNRTNTIDHVARIDGSLPEKLLDGAGFDLVLCTEVLEHVPDWTTAFVNLSKLLRPGGICIITTPFFYMPHEEPYDYWRATDHALEYFAQKCDLKIVQSLRTGSGWDVIGTLLCSTSVCRRQKSILGMMATIPVYLAHRLAIRFFKIRKLSNLVEMQTRFFVGNALVLQK